MEWKCTAVYTGPSGKQNTLSQKCVIVIRILYIKFVCKRLMPAEDIEDCNHHNHFTALFPGQPG